jgi:hypothetical protein
VLRGRWVRPHTVVPVVPVLLSASVDVPVQKELSNYRACPEVVRLLRKELELIKNLVSYEHNHILKNVKLSL